MNYFQKFIARIKVSDPEFVFDFLLHLVNIQVYTNTCHWQWMAWKSCSSICNKDGSKQADAPKYMNALNTVV